MNKQKWKVRRICSMLNLTSRKDLMDINTKNLVADSLAQTDSVSATLRNCATKSNQRQSISHSRNNSLCKYDRNGQAFSNFVDSGGGWSFWVEKSPTDDDFLVRAKYTLTRNQRCSCEKVEVDRYVRKILGIGNKYGSYGLDHSGERVSSLDDPYSGYAEADTPDGQSLFFYRMPWTQSFKFVARCVKGKMNGQVLSTIEKKFKTTGHWFGQPYTGSFVE